MSEDGAQILAFTTVSSLICESVRTKDACVTQTPGVSMTWKIDNYGPTRDNFTSFGQLDNTSDTNYRAISSGSPTFAFALDLGTINQTSNSLVFGIGLVRDPVLKYQTGTTNQSLKHLWSTRWSDVGAAVGDQFAEALTLHTY